MKAYLYYKDDCDACSMLNAMLTKNGYAVEKVRIDNPLVELGLQVIFNDDLVRSPVAVVPERGIYILEKGAPPKIAKIFNLPPIYDTKAQGNGKPKGAFVN